MRPIFHGKPIASIASLAAALGLNATTLQDFSARAQSQYTRFEIPKKNGGTRTICSPTHDLKVIQKRINRAIFSNVEFPPFLFGGIEGKDYVKNAQAHAGAKTIITLDVTDFYPSISKKRVAEIFKYFCHFPDPVSHLLAELVTLDEVVPQGACTSSYIANLVLFETEHRLVEEFRQRKLTYSRLLDDICISSQRNIAPKEVQEIISRTASLLKSKGFRIKNRKTRVSSASNPETLMEVTGLWLNRGHPRVFRAEREKIRTQLHRCEENFKISRTAPEYHQEHDRLSGLVAKLTYLNHFEATNFRNRLSAKLPHYNRADTYKTEKIVESLERVNMGDRGKISYIEKFNQVTHRINILARSNAKLATNLRDRLRKHAPTKTKEDLIYG
jgi:hypothetical protein